MSQRSGSSGARIDQSRRDPMLSPAEEQERLHEAIRATNARRLNVLAGWWLFAQVTLTFVMCAGLADAPDRRIGPLFVAVVLMCDALVFAFAGAIATLVIGEWSVLSMWTKIAGIVPLTITVLEFPLTCAGALLQS